MIRPLVTMVVLSVVFGRIAKMPSEAGAPYPVMVFAGMLPWFLFSTILGEGSNSLIQNPNLVGKVYFPRIIIPAATSLAALVDFAVNLVVLAGLMMLYGYAPGWQVLFLPVFVALAVGASLGPALYFGALNVKYRDFRYVVPFILQFGIYVSPVGFSSSAVPEQWRLLYSLNPVVGVIDGFRWCLLGGRTDLDPTRFAVSTTVAMVLLALGVGYFRRAERTFADLI